MKFIITFLCIGLIFNAQSQETMNTESEQLPYYQIPEAPDSYTGASVASRMIDGLGFRYYWATEGLRDVDLSYKPSEEARTAEETVEHIYGLSKMILNTVSGKPNLKSDEEELTFDEKRKLTLEMLFEASNLLRENPDLANLNIVFQRGESTSEFPFWNLINGPIADAIWHCGQVVSFRRASGNPFNSQASLFTGKLRN